MNKLEKIEKSKINDQFQTGIDLLICVSSFEDRCTSFALSLNPSLVKDVVLFHYEENKGKAVNKHDKDFQDHFSSNKVVIESFPVDSPIKTYDILGNILMKYAYVDKKIVIDITTLTKENLCILVKLISLYFGNEKIEFVYTPSQKYANTGEPKDYSQVWLSKGIRNIRSILGFSGEFSTLKPILLIILVGFEYERAQGIIDSYEVANLVLGVATKDQSVENEFAEINQEHLKILKNNNTTKETSEFSFSCINIDYTIDSLKKIYEKYEKDYNIVIAPMNNKISTLATGLFAINYPQVQLIYATAKMYNQKDYSYPVDYILKYQL